MPAVLADTVLAQIAANLADLIEALADEADEFENLTVYPYRVPSATPPFVDIYPADPSQDFAAMGPRSKQTFWTVRARVATSDSDGQQLMLLALMAPSGPTSLERAILDEDGWTDVADAVSVEGPTGFRLYQDIGTEAPLFGVEWRVTVFTPTGAET